MENYRLQPRDYMQLRITNAFVKPNRINNETGRVEHVWRNFSGCPTNLNPKGGARHITIDLNRMGNPNLPFMIEFGNDNPMVGWRQISIEDAIAMGWRISLFDARENGYKVRDDYVPSANLDIVIYEHDFDQRDKDPKIIQHVGNKAFNMVFHPDPSNPDELLVDALDKLRFDRAQVRVTHKDFTNKAYLELMHVYPKISSRNYDDIPC